MNEFAFLAFVVTPAVVVLLGYVAVRLQEAAGRRYDAAAMERSRASANAPRP
ncbi:hypothetical protein [Methylobacterium marchantiae]|uniref:hypothetical protein n=1 Tax=Methylobacterium marchantiae TaxID=600331 RepID=UPI00208C384C|nr:hypothetical protein AIGOOFII_2987 [Methylobacterium marchantiae]